MNEDLMYISKNLLIQVNRFDFTEDEREYVLCVVRKIIFILLIELRKQEYKT